MGRPAHVEDSGVRLRRQKDASMRTSIIIVGLAALTLTLAACGSGSSDTTVRLFAGPSVGPTTAAKDLPKLSKVDARSVDFDPIKLSGRKSKTVKLKIPKDVGAVARITSSGKKDFAVWELDAKGDKPKVLVNRVGAYQGTVLVNLTGGVRALKVQASGPWSITIKPALDAKAWDPEKRLKGTGDIVVRISPLSEAPIPVQFRHDGTRTFGVWAYGLTGSDELATGMGAATDDLVVPGRSLLVRIEADGPWSIDPS